VCSSVLPGYKNIAPDGTPSASSFTEDEFEPDKAVDGQKQTRWTSELGVPQWFEVQWNQSENIARVRVLFESSNSRDYMVETFDSSGWTSQITVGNDTATEREHVFPQPVNTTKLRLYFTHISGIGSASISELEVDVRDQKVENTLGILGIKYLILEKRLIYGNKYDVAELRMGDSENVILKREWDEITLFENMHATQKLYVADNPLTYGTLDDMFSAVEKNGWNILEHSVFVNSVSANLMADDGLAMPADFVWKEISPTNYEVHAVSKGPFFLVFLEAYSQKWKISVNGNPIPETKHLKVNSFANGWLIDTEGNLTIAIEYGPQLLLTTSVVLSAILPASLLTYLFRSEVMKVVGRKKGLFRRTIKKHSP
jgi:hypothetical protein